MNELFELYTITQDALLKAEKFIQVYPTDSTISHEIMEARDEFDKAMEEYNRRVK